MTAYYTVTQAVETKLANDPPDSNYSEIYQYSDAPFTLDLGAGDAANASFQSGLSALARLTEDRQGELTSMERAEGALAAGDLSALSAQTDALDSFSTDYSLYVPTAAAWIGNLPYYLSANGFDTGVSNIGLADSVFIDTAAQMAPSDVPEPGTAWIASVFLVIGGYIHHKRRTQSRPIGQANI
jgi:hypothetical protein